jgi:hypothetical protein
MKIYKKRQPDQDRQSKMIVLVPISSGYETLSKIFKDK